MKVANQWIEAEDLKGALMAASVVSAEVADFSGAPVKLIRKEIIIARNGIFDGIATERAISGRTAA